MNDLLKICCSFHGSSLILGDFNLHCTLIGSTVSSRISERFVDWLLETFCLGNATVPTHMALNGACSLTDLSICSPDPEY